MEQVFENTLFKWILFWSFIVIETVAIIIVLIKVYKGKLFTHDPQVSANEGVSQSVGPDDMLAYFDSNHIFKERESGDLPDQVDESNYEAVLEDMVNHVIEKMPKKRTHKEGTSAITAGAALDPTKVSEPEEDVIDEKLSKWIASLPEEENE